MTDAFEELRWGVRRRLEFIEFRLFWEGAIRRGDIVNQFNVSVPQASTDLALYRENAPKNIEYDGSKKTYVSTIRFKPVLINPTADQYLHQLRSVANGLITEQEAWQGELPNTASVPRLHRAVDVDCLKNLSRAVTNLYAVDIDYQSMSITTDRMTRRISPRVFVFDGLRWHIRALCHKDKVHKDFLLSRIFEVSNASDCPAPEAIDHFWENDVTFKLGVHPDATASQGAAIEHDYQMSEGILNFDVKAALAFYLRKNLHLDSDWKKLGPKRQQIILLNSEGGDQETKALYQKEKEASKNILAI